eukprot:CAMPEP_0197693012 /NCGR_PEP_ID=MMETSP1338-20131121/111892_1 /TAXON_ID=43686 ORGANISM="Pelagodinium beii, Strain RCC1491" /NCGR_SAMPLE_ID=MMETSP1338 /ASSEMBLY_ACC=CAM_ASM_000754 /LENGTH=59 /DNA_ID=CAMNT_0043275715 /DNA_START=313 /DNA_END=488 /DNA_ORIENTATION=+
MKSRLHSLSFSILAKTCSSASSDLSATGNQANEERDSCVLAETLSGVKATMAAAAAAER